MDHPCNDDGAPYVIHQIHNGRNEVLECTYVDAWGTGSAGRPGNWAQVEEGLTFAGDQLAVQEQRQRCLVFETSVPPVHSNVSLRTVHESESESIMHRELPVTLEACLWGDGPLFSSQWFKYLFRLLSSSSFDLFTLHRSISTQQPITVFCFKVGEGSNRSVQGCTPHYYVERNTTYNAAPRSIKRSSQSGDEAPAVSTSYGSVSQTGQCGTEDFETTLESLYIPCHCSPCGLSVLSCFAA